MKQINTDALQVIKEMADKQKHDLLRREITPDNPSTRGLYDMSRISLFEAVINNLLPNIKPQDQPTEVQSDRPIQIR
jgi:hypothetical protein